MSERDGGPAFPMTCPGNHPNGNPCWNYHETGSGMTLRDWFAGQVAADLTKDLSVDPSDCPYDDHDLARDAYMIADAMLEARKKEAP